MRKQFKRPKRTFYRLNHNIQAREVRVVDEKGKQIGVMPTHEALKQAHQLGIDLVEVAPKAKPPVCKIIDFKKLRYLEAKKAQEEKKKSKRIEVKNIRLTPFMATEDIRYRVNRAEKFLKKGDRVKIVVSFKGRQLSKKEFGYEILNQAVSALQAIGRPEGNSRFIGKQLELTLLPIKGGSSGKKEKAKN